MGGTSQVITPSSSTGKCYCDRAQGGQGAGFGHCTEVGSLFPPCTDPTYCSAAYIEPTNCDAELDDSGTCAYYCMCDAIISSGCAGNSCAEIKCCVPGGSTKLEGGTIVSLTPTPAPTPTPSPTPTPPMDE